MRRRRTLGFLGALAIVAALALAAAACGGGDSGGGEETTAAETTTPAETTAPADTGAAADTGEAAAPSGEPLVIGAAIDLTGNMAPFDGPALAAAQIQVEKINAAGGIDGRPVELKFIDTQLDPEQTKAAAIDLIEQQGAEILLVTCDVDFATPAVQEAITRGVLAVSPCIGTDQMGPKRFGEQGKLAFSIGNVAQDEGAAMAEFAIEKGWMTAVVVKDNVIVYFQNVADAFTKRYEELGGTVVKTEEFTNGDGTIQQVVTSVDGEPADVIEFTSAFDDLPAFVGGLRSLGNETPILGSWATDGTYWMPEGLNNFYYVTYASIFGDDPNPEVQDLIQAMTDAGSAPGTGGFVTGAAAIDAIKAAVEQTGSTDGATLADAFEAFSGVPTISGNISFSPELHSVFGREYRVMETQNSQPTFVELRAASSPADIGG